MSMTENILPVLAIETSGELCSVAVMADEKVYSEVNILKKHVHSQKLFDLIDQVVVNLEIDRKDIKSVAVSMGPGSFTGLRIGMAAAKGIAVGLDIPIVPVETFGAAAKQIHRFFSGYNKIALVSRVNSTELYVQKFVFNSAGVYRADKLEIIPQSEIDNFDTGFTLYGNFSHDRIIPFESPNALAVAEWAYNFGQDLVTFSYEYLEPNYVKQFIVRTKK